MGVDPKLKHETLEVEWISKVGVDFISILSL